MTIPKFLADLEAGATHGIYRSQEKPDVTQSPTPRFDLLELGKYLHVGIQFSRGCPFNCEFCDIIQLYGRKPRTKTPNQVLRELECLYQLNYRGHVDFVDDNFIANKKAVMGFLPELLAWSQQRGFPFFFSTEATINLADDVKLLGMMEAVDFRYVFVGVETPDKELLIRTQKKQNTRHPIVEGVHRLNDHGMVVTAGFILGFDGETRKAADAIAACVEAAGIPMAMVGLLTALPNTQLTWRLGFGRGTARYFWRNVLAVLLTRPKNFEAAVDLMALFLHFRKHTRFVLDGLERNATGREAEPEDSVLAAH